MHNLFLGLIICFKVFFVAHAGLHWVIARERKFTQVSIPEIYAEEQPRRPRLLIVFPHLVQ